MTKLTKWLLPAILIVVIAALNACTEPDSVGIEVQPQTDIPGVYYTDTITLETKTVIEDSLRSDEGVAIFNLVGSYTDNVFGLSRASFYSQISLPNNTSNFTFGVTPVLDSVVLTLAYADYFGDTLTPMNLQVLQMEDQLKLDSNYYTGNSFVTGQQLYTGTVEVRPTDSLLIDGGYRAPHLRLRLDDTWGTSFVNSGDANFIDNTTFATFFKGIKVQSDDVTAVDQGCVMSFNLLASMSKLTFYYKNGADTTRHEANFEINSGCPRFNHFEHDYSMASFGNTFPIAGDQQLYVQSMSGVKVRIKFPFIRNLSALGPVSINKAELVVPMIDNSLYRNHQNMLIFGVDSVGKEALTPDLLESSSYYGGAFNSTDLNYTFRLNRYIQQLVSSGSEKVDYGISLVSSGGAINGFRTIIPGTAAVGNKIQLRITYSKLE